MCRVRFGLTGIYFDSLEPNRPRGEFFQPPTASLPPGAENKQVDAVLESMDCEKIKKEVISGNGGSK